MLAAVVAQDKNVPVPELRDENGEAFDRRRVLQCYEIRRDEPNACWRGTGDRQTTLQFANQGLQT